jgi:uncharacterized iron-regulated membrane protein
VVRRALTLAHRYVGLATAAFLVVAGATGALLAYYGPLSAWLSPELHEAPGRGPVLSPLELHSRAAAAEPRAIIRDYPLDLVEGRGVAYPLQAVDGELGYDTLWLDPVTGAVLGRIDSDAMPPTRHSLMNFVYELHYALALPGAWGIWIMGIAALLWFFDSFVGAALTLPRRSPRLARWGPAWRIEPKRLNYDLHRAAGLWLWLLFAAIALSSVYFNLRSEVFMPVFSRIATVTPEPFDTRPARPPEQRPSPAIGPAQALSIAGTHAASLGWGAEPGSLRHRDALGLWQVYYEKPKPEWATAGYYGLFIDDQSGEVVHVRAPGGTAGDVFLEWIVALHLGSVFGAPYTLLLCLSGIALVAVSATGVVVWWRKRAPRRAQVRSTDGLPTRRRRPEAASSAVADTGTWPAPIRSSGTGNPPPRSGRRRP